MLLEGTSFRVKYPRFKGYRFPERPREDDEFISLNGVQMYRLRCTGLTFVRGF